MSKVVLLFLIFICVMGIFGKLKLPKLPSLRMKRKNIDTAEKCKDCGSYLFKEVECNCKRKSGDK